MPQAIDLKCMGAVLYSISWHNVPLSGFLGEGTLVKEYFEMPHVITCQLY